VSTAPFFPLYLKDWVMDTKGFTHEDKGVLLDLLCVAWERGGVPLDPAVLRRLTGCTKSAWARSWPMVQQHWVERDGVLIYPKLEASRDNLERRSKAGQAGAAARWTASESQCDRNAIASESHGHRNAITDNRLQIPDNRPQTTSLAVARSSAPSPTPGDEDDTPTTLRFPTVGLQRSWGLTDAQVAAWQGLFPHLDVLGECRAALAWLLANPSRHKTARGMPAFLVAWFGRSNDRRGSANGAAIVPLTREQVRSQRNAAAVEAVIQSYRDEEAG